MIVVAAVVVAACVVMLLLGAWQSGVTTDEPYHVQRFTNYLHSGWYIVDFQAVRGRPGPGVTDQFVYGPATMWLLHLWNMVWGLDGWKSVGVSPHAYASRHLGVALLSLVGAALVATLGRVVLRTWGWGLVACATLLATPMWLGHSMFNVKDPAVAVGYTAVTLGLVILARPHPLPGVRRLLAPAVVLAGTVLAVGTRPGMWVGILVSVVVWLVLVAGEVRRSGHSWNWRVLDLILPLAISAAVLWMIYPRVFEHPVHALVEAAFNSASFLGVQAPRLFVPVRVLLLMPLLILAFVCVGMMSALVGLLRSRFRPDRHVTALIICGVQLGALPAVTVIHKSGLYGDLRQMLFAAPMAAIFAAYGLTRLVGGGHGPTRLRARTTAVVGAAALVLPVVDQATIFPFNYGYYNAFVELAGARSLAPLDYYRSSMRELAAAVPVDGWVVCSPMRNANGDATPVAHLDGATDCRSARASPISAYIDQSKLRPQDPARTRRFYALVSRTEVPPNCRLERAETKRLGWRRLFMSGLASCDLAPVALPEASVTDIVGLSSYLLSGWYTNARTMGQQASVYFAAGEGERGELVVHFQGDAPTSVDVDGQAVSAESVRGGELSLNLTAIRLTTVRFHGPPGWDMQLTGLSFQGEDRGTVGTS